MTYETRAACHVVIKKIRPEVGMRLLSGYRSFGGATFWIITEAGRQVTTLLVPEDY